MAAVDAAVGVDPGQAPATPAQENAQQISAQQDAREHAFTRAYGPTVLQQTQSEILSVRLLHESLGNPFSVQRIPYTVMRDMATDPMLAFALFYIKTPLIRADWNMISPDPQLAAAADEAFRQVGTSVFLAFAGSLTYGHQPGVKRFRLGKLGAHYINDNAPEPGTPAPVWTSRNVQPILWETPIALPPENCIPIWDEHGGFAGFRYSRVPLLNSEIAGLANLYTKSSDSGLIIPDIPSDFAIWVVNEQEEQFGSVFGSPRTKRAYRYYWSYWFRWALADRSFENKADPPKKVYYPTDIDQYVDPEDPSPESPQINRVRSSALRLGMDARSGATLALPGDAVIDPSSGRSTSMRKWDIQYLEGGEHFAALDQTFQHLDVLKVRSMFIPEQALLEGRGGTSSRNVAAQLGEVYQESQQLLIDQWDAYVNRYFLPQWVAINFPEKIGTPLQKVTRGLGRQDADLVSQIIQLVGQNPHETLPVDIRELLRQRDIPLLSPEQQRAREREIERQAAERQPPELKSTANGTAGHNAGVRRMPDGESLYYSPADIINLASAPIGDFMRALPETPHYQTPAVRSAILRMRKFFLSRYRDQIRSFADYIAGQTAIKLAQEDQQVQQQRIPSSPAAAALAGTIVAAWAASNAPGPIGGAAATTTLAEIVAKIAFAAGKFELKRARLQADTFEQQTIDIWSRQRASTTIDSVDRTIREEMTTFLVEELQRTTDPRELAAAALDRFDDTPETHATRAIRAETRDAYNFGMLQAGKEAGVGQVQAHDASDGGDPATDDRCRRRNGRVYPIDEALREDEHPNGTLYWTYLSTEGFEVKRVDEIPAHLGAPDGVAAAYDEGAEVLFLLDETSEDDESSYLIAVGDRIKVA